MIEGEVSSLAAAQVPSGVRNHCLQLAASFSASVTILQVRWATLHQIRPKEEARPALTKIWRQPACEPHACPRTSSRMQLRRGGSG
jgi:hypothetical protein